MDSRILFKNKISGLALAAAVTILTAMLVFTQTGNAAGSEDKNEEDRPDISIEVVEDIPATEIEEERVPLADSPDTAAAGSARMMVAVWTAAVLVIAYAVFILSGMRIRKARMRKRTENDGSSD